MKLNKKKKRYAINNGSVRIVSETNFSPALRSVFSLSENRRVLLSRWIISTELTVLFRSVDRASIGAKNFWHTEPNDLCKHGREKEREVFKKSLLKCLPDKQATWMRRTCASIRLFLFSFYSFERNFTGC